MTRDTRATPVEDRPTLRTAAPFVAVGTLGLLGLLVPPHPESTTPVQPWHVVALFAVTLAILARSLTSPVRTWADPGAPLFFFVVIAAAREVSGGAMGGGGGLVALPVLWLALFGRRKDLWLSALATLVLFLVPALLIGDPRYPTSGWRMALIWTGVSLFIGPAIQDVVRRLAVERREHQQAAAEARGLLGGARLSSMIATDRAGLITSFGVGAEHLLGYRAVEVVGRVNVSSLHDPQELAATATARDSDPGHVLAELAAEDAPSQVWTYLRADGTRIFVRLAVTELRHDDGTVVGYLHVAIDATAAVSDQRRLAAAEARWRTVMDQLPDATVVVVDPSMTIELVAGAGAMRQGIEGKVGQPLDAFSGPVNMAIWNRLVPLAIDGTTSEEDLAATRTGDEHHVVVTPLDTADGPRALIVARDVSAERRREREVARARDRAEHLFLDAPHGIAVLDADGVVLEVNGALERMLPLPAGALVGRNLVDLSPDPESSRRLLAELDESPARLATTSWTWESNDDHVVHLSLSLARLRADEDTSSADIIVNVVDVSDRQRYELQLTHMADHDALTGLVNRRRFDRDLERHLVECRRTGARGALLLLDLDHFKEVNDMLGHRAGDELISSVAAVLRRELGDADIVARLGGDEFGVLLPSAGPEEASALANRLVERIRDHTATLDGTRRRVTASVGVLPITYADSLSGDDALATVDMLMYDAKDAGRDRAAVLGVALNEVPRLGARLRWRERLEHALEHDDFELHLQPIQHVASGRITGAEALLRMRDADGALVMPGRFLYIAERAGLIAALDRWVLAHALPILTDLQRVRPGFVLEVNVSGLTIGDPELERMIVSAATSGAFPPQSLVLEITETAAVSDLENARGFARRVASTGCRLALDDFGAGFGSLSYLKHLDFDLLKIDGEFVADSHRNGVDRTILRSVVAMAKALGKETVAEFVAEGAVLDVARAEGVDFAQGYVIGRPVHHDDFAATYLD
ncbi:hypothetical protein GCM10008944_29640 [Cytobacillus oceanisediminis]